MNTRTLVFSERIAIDPEAENLEFRTLEAARHLTQRIKNRFPGLVPQDHEIHVDVTEVTAKVWFDHMQEPNALEAARFEGFLSNCAHDLWKSLCMESAITQKDVSSIFVNETVMAWFVGWNLCAMFRDNQPAAERLRDAPLMCLSVPDGQAAPMPGPVIHVGMESARSATVFAWWPSLEEWVKSWESDGWWYCEDDHRAMNDQPTHWIKYPGRPTTTPADTGSYPTRPE